MEARLQNGSEMYKLISRLYPICRSITGDGVRKTLEIIGEYIPLQISEVPSGTRVFDWEVPMEWNIRQAHIRDGQGRTVLDFRNSNLHVLNYSIPVKRRMPLAELKKHIYTIPEHPAWIPYRTSYYREEWGFCMSHHQLRELREGDYEVLIDSSLKEGHLTYGECLVPGETGEEVLISAHVCHPSLCNDNLSGIAVSVFLAREIAGMDRRYSYRFLFIPGTIGAITWLSRNESRLGGIKCGLVVANVGDPGQFTYKRSRRGDTEIDRIAEHVLRHSGEEYEVVPFSPIGYDERQYCSPGIDLHVGSLTRTPYGKYPEYHSSADNLDFIRPGCLDGSLRIYSKIVAILEGNYGCRSLNMKCEPQLGRRGLYSMTGGLTDRKEKETAMLWVLNLSDGRHSLLDMAEKSGLTFQAVQAAAELLAGVGLVERC